LERIKVVVGVEREPAEFGAVELDVVETGGATSMGSAVASCPTNTVVNHGSGEFKVNKVET
jgi:hypothetical protein